MEEPRGIPDVSGLTIKQRLEVHRLSKEFPAWWIRVSPGLPTLQWNAQRKTDATWDDSAGGVRTLNAADAADLRWMLARTATWDTEVAIACGNAPYTVLGPLRAREHCVTLDGYLRGLKLLTELSGTSILVSDPRHPEADARVTCRERPSDGDRFWFWDEQGRPLCEAAHLHDAVTQIRRLMAAPIRMAG